MLTKKQLSSRIDHTLLRADATPDEVAALCGQALEYGFASVCVNPCHVPLCAGLLGTSGVMVCTVVGFPLGATSTAAKAFEARKAVESGAREVDMVVNLGWLKAGMEDDVLADIRAVVEASAPAAVKVIIETCLLTDAEKRTACALCKRAGAAFVKTSTGMSRAGATAEDVALMKAASGGLKVKAAGGIRTTQDALRMLDAGADRIGCSASAAVVDGLEA